MDCQGKSGDIHGVDVFNIRTGKADYVNGQSSNLQARRDSNSATGRTVSLIEVRQTW